MTMAMGMIAGIQASVTEHQPPAPLPEFRTLEQLAKWRAETTAKTSAQEAPRLSTLDSSTPFYTGKPYLAESGSYAFKYREYNPEMGRWITVDPSGFPDGANNRLYAAVPTSQMDPLGLFNAGSFTGGAVSFGAGIVAANAGIAGFDVALEATIADPLLGAADLLGSAAAIFSGVQSAEFGAATMVSAFTDTKSFIPQSAGGAVVYGVATAAGASSSLAQGLSSTASTIEQGAAALNASPSAAFIVVILTGIANGVQTYATALQNNATQLSNTRALIPATKNGEKGYE